MNIYVGNLPYEVTETEVQDLFGQHGPVTKVSLIEDRETGRPKGFGFVEMANQEDGEKAIEALDGHPLNNRNLKVNEARPREERPRGGGGGGGYGGGGGGGGGGGRRDDRGGGGRNKNW